MQQAEKDKQDYEAARKVYEDEAAARARGEEFDIKTDPKAEASKIVPPIPMAAVTNEHGQTVTIDSIVAPPTPAVDLQTSNVDTTTSPDFAQFTNVSDEDKKPSEEEAANFDQSMDDFQGFHDPLEDMDLSGLGAMATEGEQGNQQWDDLHNLMGEQTTAASSSEAPKSEQVDVDVAPTVTEAVAESTELPSESAAQTEAEIQQVATEAEGEMSVPDVGAASEPASGAPTEEANELPQTDAAPPAVEEPAAATEPEQPEPSFGAGPTDIAPAPDATPSGDDVADTSTLDVPASPKGDGEQTLPPPESAPAPEEPTVAPATAIESTEDAA